jgi:hypothetical protein
VRNPPSSLDTPNIKAFLLRMQLKRYSIPMDHGHQMQHS